EGLGQPDAVVQAALLHRHADRAHPVHGDEGDHAQQARSHKKAEQVAEAARRRPARTGRPAVHPAGSRTVKTDPGPSFLRPRTTPPIASIRLRTMYRPRPTPGHVRSPRWKGANTSTPSGSPMPSSATSISALPFADRTETAMVPPSGEYFTAFSRRWPITCWRAAGSTSARTGAVARSTMR